MRLQSFHSGQLSAVLLVSAALMIAGCQAATDSAPTPATLSVPETPSAQPTPNVRKPTEPAPTPTVTAVVPNPTVDPPSTPTPTATAVALDPAMQQWIGDIGLVLEVVTSIGRDIGAIRAEFAQCDWTRGAEFNTRYYDARTQLMQTIQTIGTIQGLGVEAAELTQLLLIAMDLDIQADSIRSTSMQLAIAEGRTSDCDAGDKNERDDAARLAWGDFVNRWNEIAPTYGGRRLDVNEF